MWLTPTELANKANIPVKTIYNSIRHGRLEANRVGRNIRITAEQWQAYIERSVARTYAKRRVALTSTAAATV